MTDVPPCDLSAEASVLSALLINPDLDAAAFGLSPESFYSGAHREVFRAILAVSAASKGIDYTNLVTELDNTRRLGQVGGMPFITDLLNIAPRVSESAVREYASSILDKYKARRVIVECRLAMAKAYHGECDASALLDKLTALEHGVARGTSTMLGDAMKTTFKSICDHAARGGGMTGLSTGFPDLDKVLSGLHMGDFTVIAGRPAMGKSAFAQAIAVNVAKQDRGVALFNLEMPTTQTTTRIMCSEARVDLTHPRQGIVTDSDFAAFAPVLSGLAKLPLMLDDNGSATIADIRSGAKRYARDLERQGKFLSVVIVDYLQLVNCKGSKGNREQEIAEVSRFMKEMAKEMKVAVIGLAQLNRGLESRTDKRPMLSDLRESGSIEQDADNVVFLYRDEVYHPDSDAAGTAEVIVRKQRNGPCDTVKVAFEAKSAAFRPLAPGAA